MRYKNNGSWYHTVHVTAWILFTVLDTITVLVVVAVLEWRGTRRTHLYAPISQYSWYTTYIHTPIHECMQCTKVSSSILLSKFICKATFNPSIFVYHNVCISTLYHLCFICIASQRAPSPAPPYRTRDINRSSTLHERIIPSCLDSLLR